MIPPVREFLSACEFLGRRFGWDLSPHDDDLIGALVECRTEAARLALGPEDEPAVMFYVFAAESGALGEDYVTLVIVVTLNHAMALGRRPTADHRALTRDLVRWARELAAGVAKLGELRAWFEAHLPVAPH